MPPLALSERQLPSAQQLSLRLSALAKAYDLNLAPDATSDLGEFLAVGINNQLGEVMHNLVRLTGSDRRGVDSIRISTGHTSSTTSFDNDLNNDRDEHKIHVKTETDLPKPDLNTLQHLFALNPNSHQQASPALYKLQSSHLNTESQLEITKSKSSPGPEHTESSSPIPQSRTVGNSDHKISPSKATMNGQSRAQTVQERLIKNELLKLDKGREENEGKKDRKHTLHWKYEDPAIIFKDLLG